MAYNREERIGIHAVAKIFTDKLNWDFREQNVADCGIDAIIEETKFDAKTGQYIQTGKLIGVQVKSGKSFFKEVKDGYFVFRGSRKHLKYWLGHSIPVILVIYNNNTGNAYWHEVNRLTVTLTGKAFKANISYQNILKFSSRQALSYIANIGNGCQQYRLWQLHDALYEIKLLITKPLFLYIEIEETPIAESCYVTLLMTDNEYLSFPEALYSYCDDDSNRFEYYLQLSNDQNLTEAINDIIPWADLIIGNDNASDEMLATDVVNDIINFCTDESVQDAAEFKKNNSFLRLACYLTGSYCFRLTLKANKLSYAFANLQPFLNTEPIIKERKIF